MKSHQLFHCSDDPRRRDPQPASHQSLVLLRHLGTQGNAASSAAITNFFGTGSGAVDTHRVNALEALLLLESRAHFWPDKEERLAIASRTQSSFLFLKCVGLTDGTLLLLAHRPILHGETCLFRKKFCAIVMPVVSDDEGRVLHCHIGWPGSVHDNRVWRNCGLFHNCEE